MSARPSLVFAGLAAMLNSRSRSKTLRTLCRKRGSIHHLCRARRFDTPAPLGPCSTCCAESKGNWNSGPLVQSPHCHEGHEVSLRLVKWCLVVARCEIQEAEHRWFHCSQPRQCLMNIRNRPTFESPRRRIKPHEV